MKRALLAIVMALSAASAAQADRRIAIDAVLRVDTTALAAVDVADEFSDALAAGELDKVKALLAVDALVLESGGAERSRDEYFAHHAAADAKFLSGAKQTVKRRTARANQRMAWIATESEIEAAGKKIASTETLVLEKRKGDWKIVHIHWSSR